MYDALCIGRILNVRPYRKWCIVHSGDSSLLNFVCHTSLMLGNIVINSKYVHNVYGLFNAESVHCFCRKMLSVVFSNKSQFLCWYTGRKTSTNTELHI